MSEASDSSKSSASATPSTEPIWLGIGSPRPQPRVKQNAMFGHVVDAFDEKSIVKIGEITPYEKKKRAQEELQKAAEAAAAAAAAAADAEEDKADATAGDDKSNASPEELSTSEDVTVDDDARIVTIPSAAERLILGSNVESRLLIKGGKVVNDDHSFDADVYIEDGQIKLVQPNIQVPSDTKIIDASSKLVLPGGIDTSTHLQRPFRAIYSVDDFYSGTKAALSGGTTMIVDCVEPDKGSGSLIESFEKWRQQADEKVCCDYSLRVVVRSWSDQIAQEMEVLTRERGVNTYIIALESDESLDDSSLYQIFKHCKRLGVVAQIRTENLSIYKQKAKEVFDDGITGPEGILYSRPEEIEAEAVNRTIALGSQAGSPIYITNITNRTSADIVEKSRRKGKCVFGEVMVASLAVDGSHYFNKCWRHAAGYVTSSPLRTWPNTSSYLINLLANGDLHMVCSDHSTFNAEQKALGKDDFRKIPPGVNGVAERMSIVWENAVLQGKMDPCRFVAVTSTNAAKALNVYPRKGRIASGSDADIVVWDPEASQTVSAKTQLNRCDFNIFEDLTLRGVAKHVICRGRVVVDDDGVHEVQGHGHFIANPSNPEFFYRKVWFKEKADQIKAVDRDLIDDGFQTPAGNAGGYFDSRSPCGTPHASGDIYSRPLTKSGGRNMQDSSFSLSGMANIEQVDDPITAKKSCGYRINQPPGGRTTQLW